MALTEGSRRLCILSTAICSFHLDLLNFIRINSSPKQFLVASNVLLMRAIQPLYLASMRKLKLLLLSSKKPGLSRLMDLLDVDSG